MEIENSTVILGYHSPTEWVFTPEAIALYSSVIINKEVAEKAIDEGHNSKSKYRVIKADIITALIEKGILIPKEYPKGVIERDRISRIIEFFFSEHENDMIDLLSYAYDTFIRHEEATLKSFVELNDPYWEDVTKQLIRLKNIRKSFDLKVPIKDKEVQKNILRMYFEDSILTPEIFKNGYNPIFQWEGYARFEQYLMKYRRGDIKGKIRSIQKGSEYHVLSSISNIILPCRTIRSSDEIKILIKKWEEFSNIRKEISVTKANSSLKCEK